MTTLKKYLLMLSIFCVSISNALATEVVVDEIKKSQNDIVNSLMPSYGNWCGANHPKDINNADEPINAVDRACKVHDFCYQKKGYFDCGCDKAMNETLVTGLKGNEYSGEQYIYGRSIHLYFDGSPCRGDHSGKFGPSQAVQNAVKKVGEKALKIKNTTATIIKKIPFFND